ncbi:MAG: hypothetical protein KKA31_05330 [Candidatus Margulisbacteria bacterium]|nr:hypothetical protein [Candidatus Margulisiibacteriota bacterium]
MLFVLFILISILITNSSFAQEITSPEVVGISQESKGLVLSKSEGLVIKGSQSIAFSLKSLSGSKEGYAPGTTQAREETLRINISGTADDTEIEANIYRTTATGVTQIGEENEDISIRLRRANTELYLGDFTAELTETEFARLDKVLSGARVKGDYGNWGFSALYSSPKGEGKDKKFYGDGTQGPYNLDFTPVVIDSERVSVDGRLNKRGDDYTIDYQAGSVTFLNKVIDAKSVIQIYYDYRQTVYSHATYGLRAFSKPIPNLKLAFTYLDDSDNLSGAAEIRSSMSQEAIDPQSHSVIGFDGTYISEYLTLNAELAASNRDLNLLSVSSTKELGKAAKLHFTSALGAWGVEGLFKKVDPNFVAIAEVDPKQDVWEYAGALSYRPNPLFGTQTRYYSQRYLQTGVLYENVDKNAKAILTPEGLPSLEYVFSEFEESNDPVTGASIKRVITKNSVETIYQRGFIATSLKGAVEEWLNRSPSEEVTDYKRINFGLATVGFEKVTFSSNIGLEDRQEPAGLKPYRRTYDLKLSVSPTKHYFLSSAFSLVDDSQEGQTNVTNLAYKAEPTDFFKTDGKYAITSVIEEFPTTGEAVSKQTGSFSFDLRPARYLRFRYLYKPNFTQIMRTQTLSYNNEKQQVEVNIIPVKYAVLGAIYKLGRTYNIYKYDFPNYQVKENSNDTDSVLYTIKTAPLPMLSTEYNYFQENSYANTLTTTQEPYLYSRGRGIRRQVDTLIKTSLSEQLSIDSRYTFEKLDQGSGEALSDVLDTKSHALSVKFIWNQSSFWTFSVSSAYTRLTDYILNQVTYTFSPGFGIIYRLGESLRVDFEYTYSKSFAGQETERNNYTLRTKYAVSEFVDLILRAQQEISRAPDYRLTDIVGNVEIKL